eukprot:scaffold10439_cov15-Prasinocladus_malaysianus.AAC.1
MDEWIDGWMNGLMNQRRKIGQGEQFDKYHRLELSMSMEQICRSLQDRTRTTGGNRVQPFTICYLLGDSG